MLSRLIFSIREHNLLHLAFLPNSDSSQHIVSFLWLSSTGRLLFQPRSLSITSHSFTELPGSTTDVVDPSRSSEPFTEATNFVDIPFACPAARQVLPIPTHNDQRAVLVIGDEFSVFYTIDSQTSRGSKVSNSPMASPRASAKARSPQNDLVGSVGKRRKSGLAGKTEEASETWEVKPIFRVQQGRGTILASVLHVVHSSWLTKSERLSSKATLTERLCCLAMTWVD